MGIRALEELSVDKVFMTTNALSLQKGATTPNLDNAEIKREMMKIGNQRYLLCDSSKIGTKTVCSFAEIEEFDVIITDDKISKELKDRYRKNYTLKLYRDSFNTKDNWLISKSCPNVRHRFRTLGRF